MLDETQQPIPWYTNRKYLVPLLTSVIAVILTYIPNFPFTADQIVPVVLMIIGFVAGGDVLRDQIAMYGLAVREKNAPKG